MRHHYADVTYERTVEKTIGAVVEQFGRLDIAFNNAGITAYKPIEDMTTDGADQVLATNVKGIWLIVKHEVVQMRKQRNGGSIVNTSGRIDIPGTSALPPEALGRIGQPDDIAGTVTWLSSVEAAFVTGQSLVVDGGYNFGGISGRRLSQKAWPQLAHLRPGPRSLRSKANDCVKLAKNRFSVQAGSGLKLYQLLHG